MLEKILRIKEFYLLLLCRSAAGWIPQTRGGGGGMKREDLNNQHRKGKNINCRHFIFSPPYNLLCPLEFETDVSNQAERFILSATLFFRSRSDAMTSAVQQVSPEIEHRTKWGSTANEMLPIWRHLTICSSLRDKRSHCDSMTFRTKSRIHLSVSCFHAQINFQGQIEGHRPLGCSGAQWHHFNLFLFLQV